MVNSTQNPNNTNICTRCGKMRIDGKTWKETITTYAGMTSEITHTETVCPDPECQKIVEGKLEELRQKKETMENDRAERMKQRVQNKKKAKEDALLESLEKEREDEEE